MELAEHISENLKNSYKNDLFVAYTNLSCYAGYREKLCDMNGARVYRLLLSSEKAIGDSALKSLLHRLVFESKWMSVSRDRAKHISDEIDRMLPDYKNSVIVTDVSSNDRPVVYGPHKGLAYFWEPEFGEHVTVILH